MESTTGDDRTSRNSDGEASGTTLELGRRIYARHGTFPFLDHLSSTLGLATRISRFGSTRLPLLFRLERLWTRGNLLPNGWSAPIYAWNFLRQRRLGAATASTGLSDARPGLELMKPATSTEPFAPTSRASLDDPVKDINGPKNLGGITAPASSEGASHAAEGGNLAQSSFPTPTTKGRLEVAATGPSTQSEGRIAPPVSLMGAARKSAVLKHAQRGGQHQNESHLESSDRMSEGRQSEAVEHTSERKSGRYMRTSMASGKVPRVTETRLVKPHVTSSVGSGVPTSERESGRSTQASAPPGMVQRVTETQPVKPHVTSNVGSGVPASERESGRSTQTSAPPGMVQRVTETQPVKPHVTSNVGSSVPASERESGRSTQTSAPPGMVQRVPETRQVKPPVVPGVGSSVPASEREPGRYTHASAPPDIVQRVPETRQVKPPVVPGVGSSVPASERESGRYTHASVPPDIVQRVTETQPVKPHVTPSLGSSGIATRGSTAPEVPTVDEKIKATGTPGAPQPEIAERSAGLLGESPKPADSVIPGPSTSHKLQASDSVSYTADTPGPAPSPPTDLTEGRSELAATTAPTESLRSQSSVPVSIPEPTLGPAIVKRHLRLGRQNIKTHLVAPAKESVLTRTLDAAVSEGEKSVPSGSVRNTDGAPAATRSGDRASQPFVKPSAATGEDRVPDPEAAKPTAPQSTALVSSVSSSGSEPRLGKQRASPTIPAGRGELRPPILHRRTATLGRSSGGDKVVASEVSSGQVTGKDRAAGSAQTMERPPSPADSSTRRVKPDAGLPTLKEKMTPITLAGGALTSHSPQFVPPGSEPGSKTAVFRHAVPSQASLAAKTASLPGAPNLATPLGQPQFPGNTGTLDAQHPPGNEESKPAPEIGAETGGVFGVPSLTQPKSAVPGPAEADFKTLQHPESAGSDSGSSVSGATRTHLLQPTEDDQSGYERVVVDKLDAAGANTGTESPIIPAKSTPRVLRPALSGTSESGSMGVQLVQRHLPDFTQGPIRHNFISGYGPLITRATQQSFESLSRMSTHLAAPDSPPIRSERTSAANNVVQSLEKPSATPPAGADTRPPSTNSGSDQLMRLASPDRFAPDALKNQPGLATPGHLAQGPNQRTASPSSDSVLAGAPMITVPERSAPTIGRMTNYSPFGDQVSRPGLEGWAVPEMPEKKDLVVNLSPIKRQDGRSIAWGQGTMGHFPAVQRMTEVQSRRTVSPFSPGTFVALHYPAGYPAMRTEDETAQVSVQFSDSLPQPDRNEVFSRSDYKSVGLSPRGLPTGFVPRIGRNVLTLQKSDRLHERLFTSPERLEGVSGQRTTQQVVQRIAPAAVSGMGPGSAPPITGPQVVPGPGQTTPPNTATNLDVNRLADQVYRLLVRRLASERERRGL